MTENDGDQVIIEIWCCAWVLLGDDSLFFLTKAVFCVCVCLALYASSSVNHGTSRFSRNSLDVNTSATRPRWHESLGYVWKCVRPSSKFWDNAL